MTSDRNPEPRRHHTLLIPLFVWISCSALLPGASSKVDHIASSSNATFTGCTGFGISEVLAETASPTFQFGVEKKVNITVHSTGYEGPISMITGFLGGFGVNSFCDPVCWHFDVDVSLPRTPSDPFGYLGHLSAGGILKTQVSFTAYPSRSSTGEPPCELMHPGSERCRAYLDFQIVPSACLDCTGESVDLEEFAKWVHLELVPSSGGEERPLCEPIWERSPACREVSDMSVAPTMDGGHVIASVVVQSGESHLEIVRIDQWGSKLWATDDHRPSDPTDEFSRGQIASLSDGGFLIAATSSGEGDDHVYLAKIDGEGTTVWNGTRGGGEGWLRDSPDLLPGSSGECLVAWLTEDWMGEESRLRLHLLRIDSSSGEDIWNNTRELSDLGGEYLAGLGIHATGDGGVLLAGGLIYSMWEETGGIYACRIDRSGSVLWETTYDCMQGEYPNLWISSTTPTGDGGLIAVGTASPADYATWLPYALRIDSSGSKVWENIYRNKSGFRAILPLGEGFIMAGKTDDGSNIYLVKIDAQGESVWEKVYGTKLDDHFDAIMPTDDGFILWSHCGAPSMGTTVEACIQKVDGNGQTIWKKERSVVEGITQLVNSEEGGISVFGIVQGVIYAANFNLEGTMVWENMMGDTDSASAVVRTDDGRYVAAGYTETLGPGLRSVYITKFDVFGDTVWEKAHGVGRLNEAHDILNIQDGGFLVVGESTSTNRDIYVLRTNGQGERIWENTYGTDYDDWAESATPTRDGGFLIAGNTQTQTGEGYLYLLKINMGGDVVWAKTQRHGRLVQAHDIISSSDGGYTITGETISDQTLGEDQASDVYVAKVDDWGKVEWERTYGSPNPDSGTCLAANDEGIIVASAFSWSDWWGGYCPDSDVHIAKLDQAGQLEWERVFSDPDPGLAEEPTAIIAFDDGGCLVTGNIVRSSVSPCPTTFLLRLGTGGEKQWRRNCGISEQATHRNIEDVVCVEDTFPGAFLGVGQYIEDSAPKTYLTVFSVPDTAQLQCYVPERLLILMAPLLVLCLSKHAFP